MPRSRSSSRCFGAGKSRPYAACSRSHQPAPTPTNARPPVSTSRVAAALAVMPGARNVTGVTRVPSSRPVPSPATAPRVTHGSGIGAQARSTCGIWMRWSITDSPAKPASSTARATPVSQANGSSPHGNRLTWSTTLSPCDVRRSSPAGAVSGAATPRSSAGSSARTVCTTSQPSSASCGTSARCRLSWPASVGAGTGRSRRRVAAPALGVWRVHHDDHGGQPELSGSRQPASAPVLVGAEGVDDGGQPAAGAGATTTRSSRSKASPLASRSCGPLPTTPRRASDETISSRR